MIGALGFVGSVPVYGATGSVIGPDGLTGAGGVRRPSRLDSRMKGRYESSRERCGESGVA